MPQFTSLYGLALFIVFILCGLEYLISPGGGREIAKRASVSILLFMGAQCALHSESSSLVWRSLSVTAGAVLGVACVLILLSPAAAAAVVSRTMFLGLLGLAVYIFWGLLSRDWIIREVSLMLAMALTVLLIRRIFYNDWRTARLPSSNSKFVETCSTDT